MRRFESSRPSQHGVLKSPSTGGRPGISASPCGSLSDSCIPFIAAIFPETALAAPDPIEPIGRFDTHHIFCVFVAELPFDPQPERSAVANGQRFIVQPVCKYCLRMESIDQIDAFIILSSSVRRLVKGIGAMKDDEPGGGEKARALQHDREWYTLPFAYRAPSFDTVMACDLGPLWQGAQVFKRQV